jgi:hypothetical protein
MAWLFFPALIIGQTAVFDTCGSAVVVYVVVALCDNEHQGIVPVSKELGNGDDAKHNLYWGAGYGVKTYFKKSKNWELLKTIEIPDSSIIERCVFKRKKGAVLLVADAYRGRKIKEAIIRFLETSANNGSGDLYISDSLSISPRQIKLVAYVGHNGLMDFELGAYPEWDSLSVPREVFVFACLSRHFFEDALRAANAYPLLWTDGLLAPEAYILDAAVESWVLDESAEELRDRAARSYAKYQKCSVKAAKRIFVTGW